MTENKKIEKSEALEFPFQVSANVAELIQVENQLDADYKKAKLAAHEVLWSTLYKEIGQLEESQDYHLDTRFASKGIVMIFEGSSPSRVRTSLTDLLSCMANGSD